MKEANEPNKVVSLSPRQEPSERVGDLLGAVRTIAGRRLQLLLGNMFEHVDDALFDLAEKAENNAAQMHYFDGMREVRKRRPMVERSFLAQVSRELTGITTRATPAPVAGPSSAPVELSLVAENELEESLAITSMTAKNESRLARDLFAVNQRLSVICGGIKIEDGTNPVAPAALAQAFRQAMRELAAEMRVKLIIYKLFDRYVLSALEELYLEINTELVRAGVLPQLRHEVVRADGQPPATATAAAMAGAAAAGIEGGTDTEAELASELLHTVRALFSARRAHQAAGGVTVAGGAIGAGGRGESLAIPTANELLGALSVLQSQLASGPLPSAQAMDPVVLGREVAQLKEQLLGQIGALRGERPSQVSAIDEDTIDLVGMLFEFILADNTLPAEMQVLLARLQIPYLKAAILDRKLFAHRHHPARRLLDGLADLAKGWSEESDRDHRVYDKIKSIVERLLHDFDDDMGLFDRLGDELQAFQEQSRKRAELAEQRVAESARGREKLELARRRAAREILDRIGNQTLPPLIHGVLARAWANHLVLTILRQGEDSPAFTDALRFVNEFIASARPVHTTDDRRTLLRMLPGIERALRRGLSNVAFQESDIERLLGQLHAYYRQQLGEMAPDSTTEDVVLPIPDTIQPLLDAESAESETAQDQPTAVALDSGELIEVEQLKPGTWMEFCPTGDAVTRAKLSWISPMSGRYLFVNRRGLKVGDFAPQELAAALAAGSARILPSEALFDRAMGAIVDRLSQAAAAGTADPV